MQKAADILYKQK